MCGLISRREGKLLNRKREEKTQMIRWIIFFAVDVIQAIGLDWLIHNFGSVFNGHLHTNHFTSTTIDFISQTD